MIRRKGTSWEVVVFAGRDRITGKERRVSRTVKGTRDQSRPPKEARDLEAHLKVEVVAGRHREASVALGEFLDVWLEHIRPELSPYTMQGYDGVVSRYIKPHIGAVPLAKVTTSMLDRLYRSLRDSGGHGGAPLAPNTVRHVHAVLRRAFTHAERWELLSRNPARLAQPPKGFTPEVQLPDAETLRRILSIAADYSPDLGDWVAVALAGLRRGEMAGIRWGDLDLTTGVVKISRAVVQIHRRMSVRDPKTERARRGIRLPAFALERLRARRPRMVETLAAFDQPFTDECFVFSESIDGLSPCPPDRATQRFSRVMRRHGINMRLHDLRHAAATVTLAAGVPVRTVAASLGHAQPSMTLNVYGHATERGYVQFADALDEALG